MKRNNFFNSRQIEKHLSPFGQQVLKTLVKQWGTDHDRKKNILLHQQPRPRREYAQNRVITFGEPHSNDINTSTSTPNDATNLDNITYVNEGSFDFPCVTNRAWPPYPPTAPFLKPHIAPHIVPTSAKLISLGSTKPRSDIRPNLLHEMHAKPVLNVPNATREDLLTSFDIEHATKTTKNILNEIYGPPDDEADIVMETNVVATMNNIDSYLNDNENINWEDMFDSELLKEVNVPDEKVMLHNNEPASISKKNLINFPYRQETDSKQEDVDKTKILNKPQDSNKKKRKNVTKLLESAVKTMKTSNIEVSKPKNSKKNSFRKERYTKTVKNWLNDVDPNNPVENKTFENIEKQSEQVTRKNNLKIIPEQGSKQKASKKVIQSQLANKGGVMKFKKPNINSAEAKNTDTKAGTSENETEKDKTKENKKPKFVAPIKSQIPVKDIVYDVHVVDEATATKHESLCSIVDKKVAAVLQYSNGFCQLNAHHTDDSCVPEALMCCVDDVYYSVKGTGHHITEVISKLFKRNTIICYDGKALLIFLISAMKLRFDTTLDIFDTKIAGSLLDPDNIPENFSELQKVASYTIQFTVATDCSQQKAAWYSSILRECALVLRGLLNEKSLWNVFFDIEMRLVSIIADLEQTGICVDMEALKSMESLVQAKMQQVEAECHKAAGKSFQINSTQQVRSILYDELQLDMRVNVKIRETLVKGAKSTCETMLRSLVSLHPLPALILEYRRLHKAHSTFLAGIAPHVKDGIIRPTWVQTAAATGRIACSNPNLQAIPKGPFSLSDISGNPEEKPHSEREAGAGAGVGEEMTCIYLRDVFVARPGNVLVAADFRQAECRVFARAAADTALLEALAAPDLFRHLAAVWLEKAEDAVSEADRERTKRIVYASLYGAGAHKLMDILGVDYQRALEVIASFNRTFPSLRRFGQQTAEQCALGAEVRTLCGRARSLPRMRSADLAQRAHAQRQAVNFIVQGTAADLCKLAMVRTVRRLRDELGGVVGGAEGSEGEGGAVGGARLLLQIHDELVWEVPTEQLPRAARVIKQEMERCGEGAGLGLMPVSLSAGAAWGHLTPFHLTE